VLTRVFDPSHISNIINVLAHTFLLPPLKKGVGGFVDISMSYRTSCQLVKPIVLDQNERCPTPLAVLDI
jgi:hypothetical protein